MSRILIVSCLILWGAMWMSISQGASSAEQESQAPEDAAKDQESSEKLSATQILEKMGEVYANCSSYMDKGEVVSVFDVESLRHESSLTFSTAFSRPNLFKFEYRQESSVGISMGRPGVH